MYKPDIDRYWRPSEGWVKRELAHEYTDEQRELASSLQVPFDGVWMIAECKHEHTTLYSQEESWYRSEFDPETKELVVDYSKQHFVQIMDMRLLCDNCGESLEFVEVVP
jgi:hypothetical protein